MPEIFMPKEKTATESKIAREQMIHLLNEEHK
jgi:hypothetical protein